MRASSPQTAPTPLRRSAAYFFRDLHPASMFKTVNGQHVTSYSTVLHFWSPKRQRLVTQRQGKKHRSVVFFFCARPLPPRPPLPQMYPLALCPGQHPASMLTVNNLHFVSPKRQLLKVFKIN